VNAENNTGKTPLHIAATHAHDGVCHVLISNGANVYAKDCDGKTPLDCCKEAQSWGPDPYVYGKAECMEILQEAMEKQKY